MTAHQTTRVPRPGTPAALSPGAAGEELPGATPPGSSTQTAGRASCEGARPVPDASGPGPREGAPGPRANRCVCRHLDVFHNFSTTKPRRRTGCSWTEPTPCGCQRYQEES